MTQKIIIPAIVLLCYTLFSCSKEKSFEIKKTYQPCARQFAGHFGKLPARFCGGHFL